MGVTPIIELLLMHKLTYLTIPGKIFTGVKRSLLTTGEMPLIPPIMAVTSTREDYGVLTWKPIHRLKLKHNYTPFYVISHKRLTPR